MPREPPPRPRTSSATGLLLDIAAFAVVGGDEAAARNVISGRRQSRDRRIERRQHDSAIDRQLHRHGRHRDPDHRRRGRHRSPIAASPLIRGNVIAGLGNAVASGSRIRPPPSTATSSARTRRRPGARQSRGGIYVQEENGDVTIGGTAPGEGNVIAHNGRRLISFIGGVHVRNGRTKIRGNRIFDNRYLGIDLLGGRAGGTVTPTIPATSTAGPTRTRTFRSSPTSG